MKSPERCCKIDCKADAEFEIHDATNRDPYGGTFACVDHVGVMLGTSDGLPLANQWMVSLAEHAEQKKEK